MTAPGDPDPYTIHLSGAVAAQFKELVRRGHALGRSQEVIAAYKALSQHLRNDPLIFGEPIYGLPALKLQVCVAIVPPVVAHYAVHEEKRLVFFKAIKALPGTGL